MMMYLAEIYVKKKKQFVLLCTVPKKKQTKNLCFLQDLPWITIQTRTIITEDQKIKFQSQQKKVANNIPFSKTNMALARNYLLIEKQMSEFSINLLNTELSKKNFTFLYLTSIKNITDFPISIENLLLSFHSLISIKKISRDKKKNDNKNFFSLNKEQKEIKKTRNTKRRIQRKKKMKEDIMFLCAIHTIKTNFHNMQQLKKSSLNVKTILLLY